MRVLTPDFYFRDVTHIQAEFLCEMGIEALVLDVDNTLTEHDSQHVSEEITQWLQTMQKAGIQLMLASNNLPKRVEPFAKKLQLPCVSFCCKPSPRWFFEAKRRLNLPRNKIALVGDQIFTDGLAGRFAGVKVFLVKPLANDVKWSILLKRKLEIPFLAKYFRNGGKLY